MAKNENENPEATNEPSASQAQSSTGNTVGSNLIQVVAHNLQLNAPGVVSEAPPSTSSSPKVVFKGLRAFNGQDAGFFLELLPGSRGPDGLPECVRFWVTVHEFPIDLSSIFDFA